MTTLIRLAGLLELLQEKVCGWRGHQLIKRTEGARLYTECLRCPYTSPGIWTGMLAGPQFEDEMERARR